MIRYCKTLTKQYRAVGHDAAVFPDPGQFRPDRWLDATGQLREDISPLTYGFGRRSANLAVGDCVFDSLMRLQGYASDNMLPTSVCLITRCDTIALNVPNSSLFINTAILLWAFDIREDSAEPIDTMGFTDSGTVRVLPFRAKFSPRTEHLEEIVDSSRQ